MDILEVQRLQEEQQARDKEEQQRKVEVAKAALRQAQATLKREATLRNGVALLNEFTRLYSREIDNCGDEKSLSQAECRAAYDEVRTRIREHNESLKVAGALLAQAQAKKARTPRRSRSPTRDPDTKTEKAQRR